MRAVAPLALALAAFVASPAAAQQGGDRDEQDKISNEIARNNTRVWYLEFKQGTLGRVQLKDDTGDVETYWYLPYTITNKDAVPHSYFLDITAVSDRGRKEWRYHDVWIPDVYEEVRKHMGLREGDQLLSQKNVSMNPPGKGNVLPKLDNVETRETAQIALPEIQPGETLRCVAIFMPFHEEMDRLVISVAGLTNSSVFSKQDYEAPEDQPNRRVIREAVLELHYSRPGDEFAHGQDPIVFVRRRWVDHTRTLKSDLR